MTSTTWTKTYLKYFKILYLMQYFIKLKLKIVVDFYFDRNFLLEVFYNINAENYYEALKLRAKNLDFLYKFA